MKSKTDLSQTIAKLEKHSQQLHKELQKNKIAKKFYTRSTLLAHTLRERSAQLLTGAGLIGTILATPQFSVPVVNCRRACLMRDCAGLYRTRSGTAKCIIYKRGKVKLGRTVIVE